ncbi:glycosyltransferase family 2 protein [Bacillus sp. PAMC26568]|nr:glycosyltransferase family 2 protein [Bacillus sp. PAMC26568]
MKISLLMATIGREKEVVRFLNTLKLQSFTNYELIIVDQNKDNRIDSILKDFSSLPIKHVKVQIKGLSKARNIGLKYVTGEILGFPDDDCWYSSDTLKKVHSFFVENKNFAIYTGRSIDEEGNESAGKFKKVSSEINKKNVWGMGISFTVFVKHDLVVKHSIQFDELLGVGSGTKYGSGEETDFILQILGKGLRGYYDSGFKIYHPNPIMKYNEKTYNRAVLYGAGFIKVMRKHNYNLEKVLFTTIKPLLGGLVFFLINPKKAKYYFRSFHGRLKGFS